MKPKEVARQKNCKISQEARERIEDAIRNQEMSWKQCSTIFKVSFDRKDFKSKVPARRSYNK